MTRPDLPPLVVIGGATATGKTGLSLRLADRLAADGVGVEIVSADSRQVYRGMDIGTAKVAPADRERIAHHGLDLVEPDEPFSVADFVAHARAAMRGIAERAGIALLVGGTGLYLRAVARGLDVDALPSDPAVRARLEAELAEAGVVPLARRLERLAPRLAATVDRRNPRRVVRALEIATLAGDRPRPATRGYPAPVAWLGLTVEPATHRAWILDRAKGQFRGGLLDEAAGLLDRFPRDLRSFSAIGYREAFAVLDGSTTVEGAIEATATRTSAFARRQRTWFRAEQDIEWLAADDDPLEPALVAVERLLAASEADRKVRRPRRPGG